jgi:hypothetical protein
MHSIYTHSIRSALVLAILIMVFSLTGCNAVESLALSLSPPTKTPMPTVTPTLVPTSIPTATPDPAVWYNTNLYPLLVGFNGQVENASSTPRGRLNVVITELVTINTKIKLAMASAPTCASIGSTTMLTGLDKIITGFQDFTTVVWGASESEQDAIDNAAISKVVSGKSLYNLGLNRLRSDCTISGGGA